MPDAKQCFSFKNNVSCSEIDVNLYFRISMASVYFDYYFQEFALIQPICSRNTAQKVHGN